MGLYEVPLSVSLLDFGIGTMVANFHSIVWSASLYSHVVSSSSIYFHFFMLCLYRPIFVQSLLMHFHSSQVSGVCISSIRELMESLSVRQWHV